MTPRSAEELRRDALAIWQAAIAAVDSKRLVCEAVRVAENLLLVGDDEIDLGSIERIIVVGAGKAGAGMAAGIETALGPKLCEAKRLTGWVNVPADCVRTLDHIHLHAARPAGRNEPTEAGVVGSQRILELVGDAKPDDLVIALISGGGSALLPAPIEGVTLADKQAVTKFLSGAGANIAELNTVRKALSRIKGNGLARACRAGRLAALIISDVLGDPLDIIASGPTVPTTTGPADALEVLERFKAREAGIAATVFDVLHNVEKAQGLQSLGLDASKSSTYRVMNTIIGNNATAVDAAGLEAERRGYSHAMTSSRTLEGSAEEIGRGLADMGVRMLKQNGPDCLITGGEPTVTLAPESSRGKGGRNQQLALAALQKLVEAGVSSGVVLLSGGTDGEDGPTDAAGAIVDERILNVARSQKTAIADALKRNDAYTFFEARDGLIKTGPTNTNVCDVRVVVVARIEHP